MKHGGHKAKAYIMKENSNGRSNMCHYQKRLCLASFQQH